MGRECHVTDFRNTQPRPVKTVLYITFNDAPSGIYSSQVIDVCNFLSRNCNADVTLLAFISLRRFFANRKKIKQSGIRAIVLPMFPMPVNWRRNKPALRRVIRRVRSDVIIGRGPFATALALMTRGQNHRVVFDGRGAYDAEFNEYDVSGSAQLRNEIASVERDVVLNSDFRISVSNHLVTYWSEKFGYKGKPDLQHVIIPCTLNDNIAESDVKLSKRSEYGWRDDDVIVIYAGSSAGWQSVQHLDNLMYPLMKKQENVKLILLTPRIPDHLKLGTEFGSRVMVSWVKQDQVAALMAIADYGWLVREESVTNRVSSPVKFAEYLHAGLKVITSDSMGDNADFVRMHNAGMVISSDELPELIKVAPAEKQRMRELAKENYTKPKYISQYQRMLGE